MNDNIFGTHIVNEYVEEFDNEKAAMEFGKKWHGQLKGNDDYVNNGIILIVSGCMVGLYQFSDSKTNVEIDGDVYEGRLKLEPVEAA